VALYRVERIVGAISKEEMDASGFRAIICAVQFPGLKWHRSYWDQQAGRLDCVYEAASPTQIEEHSRAARIPCDDIHLVDEVLPETYING
jgi:hypothetical protein